MKKVFGLLLLSAIAFSSCTKERTDPPKEKAVYKTYHFRVDGVEAGGTYSSTIATVIVKQN